MKSLSSTAVTVAHNSRHICTGTIEKSVALSLLIMDMTSPRYYCIHASVVLELGNGVQKLRVKSISCIGILNIAPVQIA